MAGCYFDGQTCPNGGLRRPDCSVCNLPQLRAAVDRNEWPQVDYSPRAANELAEVYDPIATLLESGEFGLDMEYILQEMSRRGLHVTMETLPHYIAAYGA